MPENFPELIKDMNPQLEEDVYLWEANSMNKNNPTPRHILGKPQSTAMTKSRTQRKNILKLLKEND